MCEFAFCDWRLYHFALFYTATGDINDPNKLKAAASAVNQKSNGDLKNTEIPETENQSDSTPAQASEKTSQNNSSEEMVTESAHSIKRSLDDSGDSGDNDSPDSKPQEKRYKHDNEVSNEGVHAADNKTDENTVSSTCYNDTDSKSNDGASMKCNIPTTESSTNEESSQNLTSNKDTNELVTSGKVDASSDLIKTSQDNDTPCNISTSKERGMNTTEKDSEDTNMEVPVNEREEHKDDHKESPSVADTEVNKENSTSVTDQKKEEEEVEWADDDTYLQVCCEILVINILLNIWYY